MKISLSFPFKDKKLNAVLEGPATNNGEDNDLWGPGFMPAPDHGGSPIRRWGQKNKWCRPSCIPISIICILIFLVVLLPLLDHATEKALEEINSHSIDNCYNTCRLSLVESIPEDLVYNNSSIRHPSTYDTWLHLINSANESIEIASLYWTLRLNEVYPDPSSVQGEEIFQALMKAGTERGIDIKIAQNAPSKDFPNIDTEMLAKRKAAKVRSVNFAKILGNGVLHTKMWIIDRKHLYIGSANMDWRALTQIQEMGVSFYNCTCMARDAAKIFEVYWFLGEENAQIPTHWPSNLNTEYNMDNPLNLTFSNDTFQTYISSAPAVFNPDGRTNDIDALLNVIQHAEKFIYVSVMDYVPLTIYTPKRIYWPVIDDALKAAAIDNRVQIKLLISWWPHSLPAEDFFLKSLMSLNEAYPSVSIEVRRFIVPANKTQQKIPFARVSHSKFMVTDNTAFIGTSNWAADYFRYTAGVSFILHDPVFERNSSHPTIRSQLQSVFERDWYSNYSHPLNLY